MLANLLLHLARLTIDNPPGWGPQLDESAGATRVKYIEFLEANTHLIYPALAILTLVLVALGIVQAMRTKEVDIEARAELKREIIRVLRHDTLGMTVETLAKNIDQPSHRLAQMLEDMEEGGMVEHITDTRRVTKWKVKGIDS